MAPSLKQYLDRIGYADKPDVSLECLTTLQSFHQLSVPFENLDVFMGIKKVLNVDILFDKIVKERRGGWCHELNGLFAWLLEKIGFNVKIVSCRYYDRTTKEFRSETFDHMALVVKIGTTEYLVDVGYGFPNQHFEPLEISANTIYKQVRISHLIWCLHYDSYLNSSILRENLKYYLLDGYISNRLVDFTNFYIKEVNGYSSTRLILFKVLRIMNM